MSLSSEPDGQRRGSTFMGCHALLKIAILLNSYLVGYVIISAPLYPVETYPTQHNTLYNVNNFPYRYIEPRNSEIIDYQLLPKFEGL